MEFFTRVRQKKKCLETSYVQILLSYVGVVGFSFKLFLKAIRVNYRRISAGILFILESLKKWATVRWCLTANIDKKYHLPSRKTLVPILDTMDV